MSPSLLARWSMGCALAATLSACAFGNETLQMPRGTLTTGVFGGQRRHITVIAPFTDSRAIQHRCGMKKNTYNIDTASMLCSEPPARWLAELLADELHKSGFEVSVQAAGPDAPGMRIDGTLHRLFVEPLIGFITVSSDAEMHVELRASTKAGLVARRSFFARTSRTGLVVTPSMQQAALDEATAQIVREMVAAVLALENRYGEEAAP